MELTQLAYNFFKSHNALRPEETETLIVPSRRLVTIQLGGKEEQLSTYVTDESLFICFENSFKDALFLYVEQEDFEQKDCSVETRWSLFSDSSLKFGREFHQKLGFLLDLHEQFESELAKGE